MSHRGGLSVDVGLIEFMPGTNVGGERRGRVAPAGLYQGIAPIHMRGTFFAAAVSGQGSDEVGSRKLSNPR